MSRYEKYKDAYTKAARKYNEANTVAVHLKLNKNTDADVIQRLNEVESKQGYIKELIRKDIEAR